MTTERLSGLLYCVQRRCRGIAVLGIHWIQLQYPIYPIQAEFLAGSRGRPDRWVRWLPVIVNGFLRSAKTALLLSVRILLIRWVFRGERRRLQQVDFDLIAKSWAYGDAVREDGSDEYLGDLQSRLLSLGFNVLLLCGDARDTPALKFSRAHFAVGERARAPEECLLRPWVPWVGLWHQVIACSRLLSRTGGRAGAVERALFGSAACESVSPTTLMNIRYYWIGRALCEQWHPIGVITLLEGRSWERCLWLGIRSVDRRCLIAGYQHAVVFPFMRSLIAPTPDPEVNTSPDIVLCQGSVTRRMLESGCRENGARTLSLGSFRRSISPLRKPEPGRKTALVLPVGWIKDSRLLFDSAAELAKHLPDHRFILRCHPALPFDEVRPYLGWSPETFPNIEVSTNPDIETDIQRGSVVIYRGTSAVLPAVLNGLKPIYAAWEPGYDEDPLFEVKTWCERPPSIQDAEQVIRAFALADADSIEQSWRRAADYVQAYSHPVTEDSIGALTRALRLDAPQVST